MAHEESSGVEPVYAQTVPKRRSWSRFLVWGVGIIVIGVMAISVLLPSLCRAREPANRVKCANNLRQIGLAITDYARDNGGQYPPSLAVLLPLEDLVPNVLVCPSTNDQASLATDTAGIVADLEAAETNAPGHKDCLSYVYVGRGLNTHTVSEAVVVAYESLDNHGGDGTNVLFGDGRVEWIDKKTWIKMAPTAGVATIKSTSPPP
jgi:prepilin-type processing-associated H-X9-DG protein